MSDNAQLRVRAPSGPLPAHPPAHAALLGSRRPLAEPLSLRQATRAIACPAFPRACPFGGACHTCPAAVQAKLAVSRPGDRYEQEADRVADLVMRMPDPCPACEPRDREEEALQPKQLGESITPLVQRQVEPEEEEEERTLQARPLGESLTPLVQRQAGPEEEEEDEEKEEPIQARSLLDLSSLPTPHLGGRLGSLRGGEPLPAKVRASFEQRFGQDFGQVRIHSGRAASEAARAVHAQAFTSGRDIVFGEGRYSPCSPAGSRLLAHELAHVVQQNAATRTTLEAEPSRARLRNGGYRFAIGPYGSDEPDELEREAMALEDHVMGAEGQTPYLAVPHRPHLSASGRVLVQRRRIPIPFNPTVCGRTLTHIDIKQPRWKELEPCLPKTMKALRLNLVGREVSSRTTGEGHQVFNLHIGIYRHPVTRRLCGIVDDSKKCIAPRCLTLGCFPTLKEVLDALKEALKDLLKVLGILALIVIAIVLIILSDGMALVPALAEAGRTEGGERQALA